MRQEAREQRTVNLAQVAGYHHGDRQYEQKLIFASDRPQKATRDYRLEKDGSLPAMIGIEVETECWGITSETVYANLLKSVVFQVFPANLWKIESDCTLDGGDVGAECITQPMTKAFIRNQYRNFKAMFEMFEAFGISCSRSGHCGQHAHISLTCFGRTRETQDEAIRKLYYIVNKHYKLVCALLYRDERNTNWCGRMDHTQAWTMDLNRMPGSHGNGFNGSHYGSGNIELRIPGGQKNYACFRNTMEAIFHLIDASKSISRKDCDDVKKIFAGCNQHVYDRLRSYCYSAGAITADDLCAIHETVKPVDFT